MLLGLTITALAFTALNVVALILVAGQQGAPELTNPATLRQVFASAGSASVIVLVLGIIGMTTEFRHMTITSSFLATPRRGRVLAAKMGAYAVVGLAVAVLSWVLAVLLAVVLLPLRDHAPIEWGAVVQILGGALLAFAIYGVLGVAVGALIRNQIAAIVAALVWVLLVESLLVAFLPTWGSWLPGGAAAAVLQAGAGVDGTAETLPVWAGALVLLGYALVFAVVAARTTLRLDIT
jgi:ABC-type transport system involved in multi-copper enzyme maturation permease subunit